MARNECDYACGRIWIAKTIYCPFYKVGHDLRMTVAQAIADVRDALAGAGDGRDPGPQLGESASKLFGILGPLQRFHFTPERLAPYAIEVGLLTYCDPVGLALTRDAKFLE